MSVERPSQGISIVLPTFNRADALRINLGVTLAIRDVGEIIIVDDGSTDNTREVCSEFEDDRIRVVSHSQNRGVAAARNTGVRAADGAWVLFGEDDCRFPADYATVLREVAERYGADIVSAPLVRVPSGQDAAAYAAGVPRREQAPSMDEDSVFPREPIRTPFLPARALVRRGVFDRVQFYEGYRQNAYREETDFFVQAARLGFCCMLTSATYCYQLDQWRGGQHHSSTLHYEYWTLRNNWHFLRRHGRWLSTQGLIRGPGREQLNFIRRRVRYLATGVARARVARIRDLGRRRLSRRMSA